jgi:hypothetical protein
VHALYARLYVGQGLRFRACGFFHAIPGLSYPLLSFYQSCYFRDYLQMISVNTFLRINNVHKNWMTGCIAAFMLLLSSAGICQTVDDVIVLPMQDTVPASAVLVGPVTAGNNATKTKCDYESLIKTLKEKTFANGGNLLKITELAEPAFIGKCYKVRAKMYKYAAADLYKNRLKKCQPVHQSVAPCATIYFYRLRDTIMPAQNYDVLLNTDSVVYRARRRSVDSIKIYGTVSLSIRAKSARKSEIKLNAKPGDVYYIRCGLMRGELLMEPFIELVDNELGAKELSGLVKRKKDISVKYLEEVH